MAQHATIAPAPSDRSLYRPADTSSSAVTLSSTVSLEDLIKSYDTLVERLNRHEHETTDTSRIASQDDVLLQQQYYNLRLTCSILLEILSSYEEVSSFKSLATTVRQTAQRCCLLQAYLTLHDQQAGHDMGSSDDETTDWTDAYLPVAVVVEQSRENSSCWTWSLVKDDNDEESLTGVVLTMSKAELAAEEAQLLRMANTPIPTPAATNSLVTTLTARKSLQKRNGVEPDEERASKRRRIQLQLQDSIQSEWTSS
jgi:hypothetical protein